MGIDYRIVNGYVYISGNPVLDPAKIGERVEFFQRRAGHYFQNWDELYGRWRTKMEALIAEITDLHVPDLPEYEPDESMLRRRPQPRSTRCSTPTAHAPLRRPDVAAPLRVPAARLRRVPDLQRVLQGQPAGHPRAAHRADGRRHRRAPLQARRRARRLARSRSTTGVDGAFVEGRTPRRSTPSSRERRRPRLARGARAIKDPWFNMAVGDGLYHFYGSWYDDPSIPYASHDRLRRRA
jgi:pyruvate,water dikinase